LDSDSNDDEEMEPQTDNTIPAGLHGDDDSRDGNNGRRNKPPPTRGGKIVQIINRGGDPNFYVTTQQQQQQSNGKSNHDCCPPYLILHDGQYSTIAFLSEEAYNSSMMRQDGATRGTKQPKPIPRKSLISISQYTISTIKCCAQRKEQQMESTNRFNEDVLPLQLVRPEMPGDHLSQVQTSINTNLLLCLYLLGPITFIGAENQGLIGETINVNCSIKVRRVLMSHMAQFNREHKEHTNACVNVQDEEEEEDYQHWRMVQRLEACHVYYQVLNAKKGRTIPMWPWESRLVGGENDENVVDENANDDGVVDVTVDPAASASTAALAASPGRVERMIRKYENLEELLQEDDNEQEVEEESDDFVDAAAVRGPRAVRASTGTNLAECDSEGDQLEEEEDAVGDQRASRASTGTYLTKWDSENDSEEEEEGMEEETTGNSGVHVQQQPEEGEEGENEKDTNTKDKSPIEQGNVAELFDNFEDINDVLDLEEDEPVIAEEEEEVVTASANATLESNDNDNGDDSGSVAAKLPENGEDNDTTEKSEEINSTQDDNAATFVGIDQMFVDSDDDEGEEEEEDEQAPLLTQQDDYAYKDDEAQPNSDVFEPSQEVIESQILLSPVKVNKKSTKSSRGHGHLKGYVESQIPFSFKGTQTSDEDDGGIESQIPFPPSNKQVNRQSLHESDSYDEENGSDIGTESQIPFLPRRKQLNTKSSHEPDSEDEEIGGNIVAESQIPFPRRKQHTETMNGRANNEEGTYSADSQVTFPQNQLMKKAHSSCKPNSDVVNSSQLVRPKSKDEITYDSEDDWMRIRKVRPTSKPTNIARRVQSQMAGEGSEEIVPTKVLDTSQIYDLNEDETGEEEGSTGISEKEVNQLQPDSISRARKGPSSPVATARSNLSASSKTRTIGHHVRFALEETTAAPAPAPVTTQRELFTSVSNKASKILLQSSSASNEPASRKRKANEDQREIKQKREFSFGTMFDRVKRLWPSHPDDDDEEGEV